jgi:hypothetical protein
MRVRRVGFDSLESKAGVLNLHVEKVVGSPRLSYFGASWALVGA